MTRTAMTRTFEKLERAPAYRMLADALAEKILTGQLATGAPLPTEAELCEAFGVKRTTVREGIRALEEAGLLRRETGGKKLIVTRPSQDHVSAQLQRAMILHQVTNGELCDALLAIEPALSRAAASRIGDEHLLALEGNIARTLDAIRDSDSGNLTGLDTEFHGLIAEASGNRALMMARRPLMPLLHPAFGRVLDALPNAGTRMLKAHRQIVKALADRSEDDADAWMARHVRDFKRGFGTAGIPMDEPIQI